MRKIIVFAGLMMAIMSCENQDIEFDDYEFQGVYFPHQRPLRSIMLGDEVIGDNSIDLEHAFSIGAATGGAYVNNSNIDISVELAPELAQNITDGNGNPLAILPANYYNATFDKINIPSGSFFGKMRVDLTDDFFQDPLSTGLHYVLPVKMTNAVGIDSILQGDVANDVFSPDPRVAAHWNVQPKDYVLFGIKYINSTHGVYLLRGQRSEVGNTDPNSIVKYSEQFLTDNGNIKLFTESLTESYTEQLSNGSNGFFTGWNPAYSMKLTFDEENNSVVVSQKDATTVVVNGTGKIYSKDHEMAEGYNGKKHRTIYLDYTFEDAGKTYQVNDSLVFIDTDMKFEEFQVNVVP